MLLVTSGAPDLWSTFLHYPFLCPSGGHPHDTLNTTHGDVDPVECVEGRTKRHKKEWKDNDLIFVDGPTEDNLLSRIPTFFGSRDSLKLPVDTVSRSGNEDYTSVRDREEQGEGAMGVGYVYTGMYKCVCLGVTRCANKGRSQSVRIRYRSKSFGVLDDFLCRSLF